MIYGIVASVKDAAGHVRNDGRRLQDGFVPQAPFPCADTVRRGLRPS